MARRIKKDPVIDEEITRIYNEFGEVKPSIVLKEAEGSDAPLHSFFEWDNGKAGHEYRLIQSRTLIRVARVTVKKREKPIQLVHVPVVRGGDGREGKYLPVEKIIKRKDDFTAAMNEALLRLNSAERAVKALDIAAKKQGKADEIIGVIAIAMQAMNTATESVKALN